MSRRRDILDTLYVNWVRLFKRTELYQPSYRTREFTLLRKDALQRDCEDRVSAIVECLPPGKGSYLDIGSQFGYFVFRVAEQGFMSHGMEADTVAHNCAVSLGRLNRVRNVFFHNARLDEELAKVLPVYDVISILNVFHHLVHKLGFDSADRIIRTLCGKCESTLFFETGESEETDCCWSKDLAFMGSPSREWIADYLASIGFSEVREIGRFRTHLSAHKRTLFCCAR